MKGFGVLLICLVGCSFAYATPILWNLQEVAFSDGGALTGSFIYDASTNSYQEISIVSTGSLADTYTTSGLLGHDARSIGVYSEAIPTTFPITLPPGTQFLRIFFEDPLTDAGGTVRLDFSGGFAGGEDTCIDFDLHCTLGKPSRLVASGSVTGVSVPEPATAILFATGLFTFFMLRRRST